MFVINCDKGLLQIATRGYYNCDKGLSCCDSSLYYKLQQQQQQPLLFPFFLLISYMYFTINKRRKGYWRPVITIGLKVPDRQLHSQLAKYGRLQIATGSFVQIAASFIINFDRFYKLQQCKHRQH